MPGAPKVALLTNFIPPYRAPLFRALAGRVGDLRIFLSTTMEPDRPWTPSWPGLRVTVGRTVTVRRRQKHPRGYTEEGFLHIPWDTLWNVSRYGPDVVISAELGARTLQAALYRWIKRSSRLIVWADLAESSEEGRTEMQERVRRALLRRCDAVLVNGASGARYVERFGIERRRVFQAPCTVETEPFLRTPLVKSAAAERRLLYVGRLVEFKGLVPFLGQLARWAAAHPKRNVEFLIVGDGPMGGAIERFQPPPNLAVQRRASVDYEQLPDVYAEGGILVLPSLAEPWGLVVNEALTAGLPVLGSVYSQAVQELVAEGVNGWTFAPDRSGEMLAAIDRALNTPPEKLLEMRYQARASVSALTPEAAAARIEEAIHWCSEQSR